VLQFITTVYIWVTLHTAVEWQKTNSLLHMPAYIDRYRGTDFPALQYVCSHLQVLVQLSLYFLFTYVNISHLKVKVLALLSCLEFFVLWYL